ncbi:MAG: hypothetical protein AAGI01_07375 [Myxococcota bacterium]
MRRTSVVAALVCAWMMMAWAPSAMAQDTTTSSGGFGLGTSTTTTTTAVGVTVAVPFVITTSSASAVQPNPPAERRARRKRVRLMMQHNRASLEQALALGGAESAADLAHLFKVSEEDFGAFAKALRAERAALAVLIATDEPTLEDAERLVSAIEHVMATDAALRDDYLKIAVGPIIPAEG